MKANQVSQNEVIKQLVTKRMGINDSTEMRIVNQGSKNTGTPLNTSGATGNKQGENDAFFNPVKRIC